MGIAKEKAVSILIRDPSYEDTTTVPLAIPFLV
jgi:hypothetical protein